MNPPSFRCWLRSARYPYGPDRNGGASNARMVPDLVGRAGTMKRNKHTERDVEPDEAVAASRDTGGVPDPDQPDQATTTGTTPNEEFVGRVTGQDVGYAEETGAEARAADHSRDRDA
ncbi:hypothetical protein Airi02_037650 [Actinoallomurus iriomotensis]|uniref:Uncharacterized protein n=2 Tax=Actinoallomurus iriomotensis TaxID=478107 RepID=A0A9W6W1D0_9ACTN|nr:hypothetical protein Airi02_037650 [Actinoallomurus iriomotensis]